jgi:fructokinase
MAGELIGAIEAGGTKFVLALARPDGTILARERIATGRPETTWPALTRFFDAAQREHGAIGAFGVASFGPLDIDPVSPSYGTFAGTPKPGWHSARWHDALGAFGVPLAIDSDVNGAALGEWAAGAGRGTSTLAYTTVGTGIGSGVVKHGRSVTGFSHYESGHIRPPHDRTADPYPGGCPFHGDCLEGLAAGPAIEARWGRRIDQLGDPAQAVELIAGYLAHLAVNLVLLHMPERLVFGGGVLHTPGMIEALRRRAEAQLGGYIRADALDPGFRTYIVAPGLGDEAGIVGAILLGQRALG